MKLASFLVLLSLLASSILSPQAIANLPTYDVSGEKGPDGTPGRDYSGSTASGTGSDGTDGGDAGEASPGTDAGEIDLELSTPLKSQQPVQGVVVIKGQIRTTRGRDQKETKTVEFGKSGYIHLRADGGNGGRGGTGGTGQNGAKGYRGDDATQYSHGTDGGPGGNGGHGGTGTSGARAGDGGAIKVRMSEQDTHLIMLVKHSEAAGSGGAAGQNGSGGRGGPGGDGGNSYTWSEIRYVTKTVTETDAEGNVTEREIQEQVVDTYTNPGGSDGPRGNDGQAGNARLDHGADGKRGSFRVEVVRPDGAVQTYDRPFDLKLQSFHIESDNKDGIIEPNEIVHISNVIVKNTGGMPTPAHHDAVVFVESGGWIISDAIPIKVSKSLAPGESITLENQEIKFRVRDTIIAKPGERLSVAETVDPVSMMSDVHRRFEGFNNPKSFEITFPIEITPLVAEESLAPGGQSRIYLKVRNISTKPFGKLSDLKREIALKLKLDGGELTEDDIEFKDSKGLPHPMSEGFLEAIENLGPGKEVMIQGVIGIKQNAAYYTDARLRAELQLGKIADPSLRSTIQMRDFTIRVAQLYSNTPGAGVLLITNHGSQRKEVETWKAMLKQMGLAVDVWDLSLNGFLALSRELSTGSNLLKDFEGKTVILLNNEFEAVAAGSRNAVKARGHYFLAKQEFFKAASANGTHFYLVGGDADSHLKLFNEYLVQTSGGDATRFPSVKAFFENLAKAGEVERSAEKVSEEIVVGEKTATEAFIPTQLIEISQKRVTQPQPEHLQKVAENLQTRLERIHPDRRYVVIHEFAPELAKKGLLLSDWNLGRLRVHQTLDQSVGSAVALAVDEKTVHKPEFIRSNENHLGLFMAMTMDQKLELMNSLIKHDIEILDADIFGQQAAFKKPVMSLETAQSLVDSILISIADEQNALRRHRWKSGLSRQAVAGKLKAMGKLASYPLSPVLENDRPDVKNDPGELMIKLAAGIRFLAEAQDRWYDFGLFGRKDPMVTTETLKLYEKFVERVFGRKEVKGLRERAKEARAMIAARVKELRQRQKELAKRINISKKDAAMMMALLPETRSGLTIDTQASRGKDRTLTPEQVRHIEASEANRNAHREGLEREKARARAELAVPEEPKVRARIAVPSENCEALLTQEAEREALEEEAGAATNKARRKVIQSKKEAH